MTIRRGRPEAAAASHRAGWRRGSDGNFDINAGSDFITASYTKFW